MRYIPIQPILPGSRISIDRYHILQYIYHTLQLTRPWLARLQEKEFADEEGTHCGALRLCSSAGEFIRAVDCLGLSLRNAFHGSGSESRAPRCFIFPGILGGIRLCRLAAPGLYLWQFVSDVWRPRGNECPT
jgi:hypothetical protein